MKDKNDNIVLYLGGGAMSGVFGAGLVSRLQELDIYNRIDTVYGASAGAMNGAYFLSGQAKLGSTAYYEDLTSGFIFPWRVPIGFAQRVWSAYVKKIDYESMQDILDIDYVIDIQKHKKKLDIGALRENPIPFFAKVLNIDSGEIEYLDVKKNPWKILKAASSPAPYWFGGTKINGSEYIDAAVVEPVGLDRLLERHPDQKMIVAINFYPEVGFTDELRAFIEGSIANTMYDLELMDYFAEREKSFIEDLRKIRENDDIFLIHPPRESPTSPMTTNSKKLKTTYNMGKKAGDKVIDFI